MSPLRDHKAEYARRIASAARRGLSRSQARGHARTGEAPLKPKPRQVDDRLEAAIKELRRTGNRAEAARAVNVSTERLRRYLRENVEIEGRGRTLKIIDNRLREVTTISKGAVSTVRLRGFDPASLNGDYLNAVKAFLTSNDIEVLAAFAGRSVIDARGVSHPFETNPNTLRHLVHAGDELFHEIYRLIL